MSDRKPHTPDLFGRAQGKSELPGEWPDPARFPLNLDDVSVGDVVLEDLRHAENPLIVAGYASLDKLVEFIAGSHSDSIRIVFGSEPHEGQQRRYRVGRRRLPREMREYWLSRGFSVLLAAPVLAAITALKDGRVQARYLARPGWRLHAKLFVGEVAATLGSSNFTASGLGRQFETNARFEAHGNSSEAKRYRESKQIAEHIWDLGTDYNTELATLLEQLLDVVGWKDALARAATELLAGEWADRFLAGQYLADDAHLWPSQKLGIAQALYILKERGSVLFADATGSGKTRAGVHLIGAKMHDIIRSNRLRTGKALLIAPPSVVQGWKDEAAIASVPLDVFSHGGLSHASAGERDVLLTNLRRAQVLCVDEGHNFLNNASRRTQQLLRNMADHVVLFTATPINRSAQDLLRIADMLGADNLDDSTQKAFEKMLGVRSLSRSLGEDEIAQLRGEIARFTVRRTKRMLNTLIEQAPDEYRDAAGRRCRFPKHNALIYALAEPAGDRELAARIRELAGRLCGVLHFRKDIALPANLARKGVSEQQFLDGRLRAANKLSQYMIMHSLRSSTAALVEHLLGSDAAIALADIEGHARSAGGNIAASIEQIAGRLPKNRLAIELPDWLSDSDAHRAACEHDRRIVEEIAALAHRISPAREAAKARHLAELSSHDEHVLAFDTRPITLAVIRRHLADIDPALDVLVATGDAQSQRSGLLRRFAPTSREPGRVVGLCSDSVSEGVNLQRARVVVHLDMPSVVRVAEQRVGRVDRLDSPHKTIDAWWPDDAEEFALKTDERFIERYETVDNLLGSNMPLPDKVRAGAKRVSAHEAIREYQTSAGEWDGIDDAFSPVRRLIEGDRALVEPRYAAAYRDIGGQVLSRVSLVAAERPWAFFCTRDSSGIPKWIMLENLDAETPAPPDTDLETICRKLRRRLADTGDCQGITRGGEKALRRAIDRLSAAERKLVSRRKRRALEEMEIVLQRYLQSASDRGDQAQVDGLWQLLEMLDADARDLQPDWDEIASRWLDLIRPVWYERLRAGGRNKPLLLKDIRAAVIANEADLLPKILDAFASDFPAQRPANERIVACIVGVPGR
ncbi:MAG: SNF2-related protein [Wenzhouxiangellaceae bacterium]